MEGIGTSGTLHWNGTRLGDFIDDGNGGCVIYHFPTEGLNKAIAEQLPDLCTELYGEDATWMTPDLDSIVLHLADLADREKVFRNAWRRARKQGGTLVSAKGGKAAHYFTVSGTPTQAQAEGMILDALRRQGETGDFEVTVWVERPELNEGTDRPVRDKDVLVELRAFRKKADELDRKVKARLHALT